MAKIKFTKKNEGASQNESIGAVTRNPGNRYKESFMIDCGTPENALALADAIYDEAYGHPAGGALDDAGRHFLGGELIQCWPVGHFFTASVDPCEKAIAWCRNFLKDLGGSAPGITGNDAGLESKGDETSEDRRGTDRYGHSVKRFTTKDLKGLDGGEGDDDAGTPDKFGLAYLDTVGIDAFSNNHDTAARDRFLHDLAQMPVSKKSIEDLLRKHPLHRWGRTIGIRDYFPENGIAYLGTPGPDGLPYKSLVLRWGPALKKS